MDQGLMAQLEANYQATKQQTPKMPKRNNPGGIKGIVQSLMPLAGGALGALAGIPLGPAGILAGGAAGSAGGEALKQKFQGGPIDRGDIAEQGIFGAIPGLGAGFKALRAGGAVSSLIRGAEATAPRAAEQVATKGLGNRLYNKGVITEARSGGYGPGEKVTGGNSLGFRDSEKMAKTLQKENISGANASSRQIAVGDRLNSHLTTIDAAVEARNAKVPEHQLADIIGRVQRRIIGKNGEGVTGFQVGNKAQVAVAQSYLRQLAGVKDAKGLLEFKRRLDQDAINYGRNSMANDPVREQIAKAFREEVNKDFGKLVPEAKAASKSYSELHDVNEFLKQAARDQSNAATQGGAGGVVNRVLTSDTANTVRSKGGRGMQQLGKLMGASSAGEAQTATPVAGAASNMLSHLTGGNLRSAALRQGVSRATVQPLIGNDAQAMNQEGVAPEAGQQLTNTSPTSDLGLNLNQESSPESAYPKEAFMADVQRDPKNAATYLSLFKQMEDIAQQEIQAGQTKGLNSTASGVVADTTTGLNALQQLSGHLADSNANSPGIGFLRGKNPFDTNAQQLQADINTTKQIVGKALEGGVLRKEDEIKYKTILPTLNDTEDVAQYKINALINLISGRLGEYKASLGGTTGGTVLQTVDGTEVL